MEVHLDGGGNEEDVYWNDGGGEEVCLDRGGLSRPRRCRGRGLSRFSVPLLSTL